jgi:peptide/nickel transport system substrate-binding protein
MTRAPFDDIRARRAVDAAIDRDAINTIRSGGNGTVPATLFPETSEFYEPDLEINGYDPERAQRLLDELAADGKPLKFTILSYPGTNTTVAAQAIQSQLGAYDNVTVEIEVQDFAGITARTIAHDFDANTSGMFFGRPEPELSRRLASDSRGNITGIVDPEIDEALRVARRTDDAGVRRQAYATIQERFIDQVPMVIYERNEVAVVHAPSIGGVAEYGAGSPKVDTLWLAPTDTE